MPTPLKKKKYKVVKKLHTGGDLGHIHPQGDRFTDPENRWSTKEQNAAARRWWVNYLQSPKYLERLAKEFPDLNEQDLLKERDSRLENVKSVTMELVNKPLKFAGYGRTLGTYTLKPEYQTKEGWAGLKESGYSPHSIQLEPNPYFTFRGIGTHELGHAVYGDKTMPQKTKDLIASITKEGYDDYLEDPDEFVQRIQVLRHQMQEAGVYDPFTEDFTEEHLKKYRETTGPTGLPLDVDSHYKDLFDYRGEKGVLKGGTQEEQDKNFIKAMNEIADLNVPGMQDIQYASRGMKVLKKKMKK